VHDNLRRKLEENKLEQAQREPEACPVMSIFHHLQTVTIEVNIAIEVHIVECLHWNLVSAPILELIGLILECKIVFDGTAWNSGLFSLARTEGRSKIPEADQDWDRCEKTEEDAGLQSAADFPRKVRRYACNEGEEEDVGEAFVAGAIGRERSILDCWVLRRNISIYSIDACGEHRLHCRWVWLLDTYRSSSHTTLFKFLEGRSWGFGSLNKFELALRAIDALGLGRHACLSSQLNLLQFSKWKMVKKCVLLFHTHEAVNVVGPLPGPFSSLN
jgi:hypothetical protein